MCVFVIKYLMIMSDGIFEWQWHYFIQFSIESITKFCIVTLLCTLLVSLTAVNITFNLPKLFSLDDWLRVTRTIYLFYHLSTNFIVLRKKYNPRSRQDPWIIISALNPLERCFNCNQRQLGSTELTYNLADIMTLQSCSKWPDTSLRKKFIT